MATTKVTDALRNVTAVDAAKITTGTIPEARIATLAASKLTGTVADARFPATLPATSGVNLTALNGSNIGSGTVPTARLGTGTASSSTFLRGDSTYAAAGGGKILQCLSHTKTDTATTSSTSFVDTGLQIAITPSATSSKIMIWVTTLISISAYEHRAYFKITGGNAASYIGDAGTGVEMAFGISPRSGDTYAQTIATGMYLDSPNSTSAITYKLTWAVGVSATLYMNRSNANYSDDIISASTISVMEIGA
jgi:hypothetical protein